MCFRPLMCLISLPTLVTFAQALMPLRQMLRSSSSPSELGATSVTNRTQWITQPLDHFEPGSDGTWQQRYLVTLIRTLFFFFFFPFIFWRAMRMSYHMVCIIMQINATFFDGTGPVFLCVGGEGPGFTEENSIPTQSIPYES